MYLPNEEATMFGMRSGIRCSELAMRPLFLNLHRGVWGLGFSV